jgi:hypothetical protein
MKFNAPLTLTHEFLDRARPRALVAIFPPGKKGTIDQGGALWNPVFVFCF